MESNNPVLVGTFLASAELGACQDEGDPAFILQVPSDQFRDRYVFLIPPTYTNDYVDVVAPLGASVTIDGELQVMSTELIGGTEFTRTSFLIADGSHVLQASEPVGISVYGYGGGNAFRVSYGYPGGLNLNLINPIE